MDCWKVLGLEQNDSQIDIKTAFRYLSKKYHPDCGGPQAGSEKLTRIVEAYRSVSAVKKKEELLKRPLRTELNRAPLFRSTTSVYNQDIDMLGTTVLSAKTPEERRLAARRLGFIGKKKAWKYLRQALYDSDERVVSATIRSVADLQLWQAEAALPSVWERASEHLKMAILDTIELTGEAFFIPLLQIAARDQSHIAVRAKILARDCRDAPNHKRY